MKNCKQIVLLILALTILTSCSSEGIKDKSPRTKKAELYYSQGTSLLIKRKYTEALDHLIKADQLTPSNSKVKNNLAMAYYFKNKTKMAIDILKQSIELNSKNSDAKVNLGSIYMQLNQLNKAKSVYQEILRDLVYKHQYRTYYNLALIALKEEKHLEAQKHLYLSLKEKNDYCPSLFQLGILEKEKGNHLEALKHFRESTKSTCTNDPRPHFEIAESLLKLRRVFESKTKYKDIIKQFPNTIYAKKAKARLTKAHSFQKSLTKFDENLLLKDKEKLKQYIETPDF